MMPSPGAGFACVAAVPRAAGHGPSLSGHALGRLARALVVLLTVLAGVLAGTARADELVLFETGRCPWCVKWHREIGPIYPRTEEGKLLPLRRVDLLGSVPPDLRQVAGIKYTPTFVVMTCGREAGRIVGYASDEQFWGELSIIVAKLRKTGWPQAGC